MLRYFPFLSNKSTDIKSSLEEKTASTRTINNHWMINWRRLLQIFIQLHTLIKSFQNQSVLETHVFVIRLD